MSLALGDAVLLGPNVLCGMEPDGAFTGLGSGTDSCDDVDAESGSVVRDDQFEKRRCHLPERACPGYMRTNRTLQDAPNLASSQRITQS